MEKPDALLESALTLCLFLSLLWFGKKQNEEAAFPSFSHHIITSAGGWKGSEVPAPYDWAILGQAIGAGAVAGTCSFHFKPFPNKIFTYIQATPAFRQIPSGVYPNAQASLK
ncbi:hypothetical protein [Rufibacter sp. LB8]|uniref:hypothetical protein n=1 Tax=Rufibacter sp. LB8 TaxID=2777781 RepID=UPI00178C81E0|nr:hypothetical protein [Rufibacter sp. LB8]